MTSDVLLQERRVRMRSAGGGANVVKVTVAISTMRRDLSGKRPEYLWETLDSLVPFLGVEGHIEVGISLVDVEPGDGSWKRIIEERYGALISLGVLTVTHLTDVIREGIYANLTQTCKLHRLYGDEMQRVIWRSKRVLDFAYTITMATSDSDYIFILEDDTPILGDLRAAVMQCHVYFGAGSSTACRWDFLWRKEEAQRKLVPVAAAGHLFPKMTLPQGALPGLYALMLPAPDWLQLATFFRIHFDKAPADWLIGRWLFAENFRLAYMPAILNCYHGPGTAGKDSTLMSVQRQLASFSFFHSKPLSWENCTRTAENTNHPFKWELIGPKYLLRWVGGSSFFLEIPWIDIEGHDIGSARDFSIDEDARMYVCEKTPTCRAVNRNGWMKKDLVFHDVSPPQRAKRLFVQIPASASDEFLGEIRSFYLKCWDKLPDGAKKTEGHANNPSLGIPLVDIAKMPTAPTPQQRP